MEIWVEFTDKQWRFSPDPAVVPSGTLLQWRFRVDHTKAKRLRWTVYFDDGHPFSSKLDFATRTQPDLIRRIKFSNETSVAPDGQHVGVSEAVVADEPGYYKYGVRLHDVDEDTELGDEDPRLVVLGAIR